MSLEAQRDHDPEYEKSSISIFDRIILLSLKQRRFVLLCAAGVLVSGTVLLLRTNIDVLPDLNRPVVTVVVEGNGLAPAEIETLITIPLESALNGAPGVEKIRSVSKRGVAMLHVEFPWGSDIYLNRQIVSEKLVRVRKQLPPDVQPLLGPVSSIMGEIQLIGIHSREGKTDLKKLRTLADWTIRRRLLAIPGISNVIIIGGEAKEYQIIINSDRLAYHNISLRSLTEWLANISANTAGGFIEKDGKEYVVRNQGAVYALSEIENAVIGYRAGIPIRLKQVATVRIGHRVKRGDAGINGRRGVILAVQKQPSASTLQLTREVEQGLAEIRSRLPEDVIITPRLFRQSEFINRAVDNVVEAIRDGSIILALVLFAFLWNVRTTLITLVTLPLSLLASLITLNFLGYGVNTMTLGGLAVAIGLLVDDAIVDTENIFRRLKENQNSPRPEPILAVVFKASSEIRNSIVLATFIIVLVFLPLLFLDGVEGRLFRPMAMSFILSLLLSLLVALTVTPVLCYYLLPGITRKLRTDSALVRLLQRFQKRNLEFFLRRKLLAVLFVSLISIGCLILLPFLGREFLPAFNEGTLTLEVITPAGTSLNASVAKAKEIEKICLGTKGVVRVSRRTGRSELDEHAEGVHYSEFDVTLASGAGARKRSEILAELREKFKRLEDVAVNTGQPITHRLDHILSGIKAEVAVFIYGRDLRTLLVKAHNVRSLIEPLPGVEDLLVETQNYAPELKIAVRHDMAARYGVSVGRLTATLERALNGHVVSGIIEGERTYDLRVILDEGTRRDKGRLARYVVKYLPDATPVTLGMLAEIYESTGPYEIKRENASRRIAVQFNVGGGRDLTATVHKVRDELRAKLKLEPNYHYEIGGRYVSQQRTILIISILGCVSLGGVVMLIYGYFRSWVYTLQILVNIPLSFAGGVLAMYFADVHLSIAGIVGFIALAGIASRNGIMMISHFIHLMEKEGEAFSPEMVIRGALERLVPVLMTVFTAVFALLPVIVTGSESPGKEILFPVSVVIVGGLISSTLLDLILTPVLFHAFGKAKQEAKA